MITKLYIENFRSLIRDEIDLGKITILTGPNNSGKSSIIYGLLALKNIVLNSNQSLDSCLALGFINLGGFSQTVHLKNEDLNIILGIDVCKDGVESNYSVSLGKKKSEFRLKTLKPYKTSLNLEVGFPYAANRSTGCEVKLDYGIAKVTWNGITPTISIEQAKMGMDIVAGETTNREIVTKQLSDSFNRPMEELRGVDFVPLRRGFMKPIYSSVPMQQQLLNEDELATLLSSDRDLEGKVAHYLAKIVDRIFNVRPTIGTANFNLQSRDISTGLVCDLVNEGFGTNQLVTILTKSLRKEMRTICIEESEIHLHPELMDKLVDVLIDITKEEEKNFIISTHSEHIVLSLLNKVKEKKIGADEVKIYYLNKDRKKAKIEKQKINDKGQIEGGLKGFYETELSEVKEFFNVSNSEDTK
ncbi:MAG: AAA family ATPase [Candidatus Omnitrophica bacterium]|nr:AAA family ATPase [Candidatus Omnitrophota bacterium]